ncbi:hypothetical protein [Bradyrhizobium monzae]|uniref:hypothetical protein n=1 Tax=Bradyrhizobium sp. Oc8 TaxID=2876780 RepID=UPI001F1B1367|nr:hypothetical protein [Bradyrhizobium sp. Oc8]
MAIATATAAAMVGSFGLAGDTPLLYLGAATDTSHLLSFESVRGQVSTELEKSLARSTRILRRHRNALDAIAGRLMRHGRIEGREVEAFIDNPPTPDSYPDSKD